MVRCEGGRWGRGVLGVVGAAMAVALAAGAAPGQVVISQAFGGFGSDTPDADYVELFNRGTTPVDVTGWAVQVVYNPDADHWTAVPLPSMTLQPGQHLLVAVSTDVTTLPTPDAVGTSSSSTLIFSDRGTVALTSTSAQLPDGCATGNPAVVDLIQWGGAGTCFEGTGQGPITTSSQAIFRKNGGCQDINDNASDLVVGTPNPRNSSYQWPFEAITSLGNVAAAPTNTITLTARGRSNACGASGNVPLAGVSANLGSLGGSTALQFVDNGTNGDAVAGDGVWTARYTIPAGQPTGSYPITFSLFGAAGSVNVDASVIVPVLGDTCAAARTFSIADLPFTQSLTATDYTDDAGIVPCRSVTTPTASRYGHWWAITPAQDVVVKVAKNSTLYNLSLYTGPCDALTIIDCDDSNAGANFRMRAGITYHILSMYDNTGTPTTQPVYTFSVDNPPANDVCTGAIDLNAVGLPFTDTNGQGFMDASSDIDNTCDTIPLITHRGVWYTYVPATDVILTTNETVSGFNVGSSVWTGTCPSPLTQVACSNTDRGDYNLSAGVRYYIMEGIRSSATPGSVPSYNNTFSVRPVPANDLCPNAIDVGSLATPFTDAPVLSQASADTTPCGAATFGVWYRFTAPSAGALRLNETSSVDVSWAVVDACDSAASRLCTTTDTAQFVDVQAGQTVRILLYTTSTAATPAAVDISFVPALPNDVCSGAVDVSAQPFPYNTLADARGSIQHDMDIGPCTTMNSSSYALWYKYTAASTGLFTIVETSSDNADIGVWEVNNPADPCNSLGTQIGCIANTNDAGVFRVTAGRTYIILIGSQPGASGPVRPTGAYNITFDAPQALSNDHCGGATMITGLPYQETVNAFLADSDPLLTGTDPPVTNPSTCQFSAATVHLNTVWYSIIPSSTMALTIWDTSTTKSLAIGLFDGCGAGGTGGTELDCGRNDVTFNLDAGRLYLIRVGSNSATDPEGPSSLYRLNFVASQRLANDACASAIEIRSFPDSRIVDASDATADGPTAVQTGCNTGSPAAMSQSIWYKIRTVQAGQLTGAIEPDYARADSGVAALFLSSDGTCAGINPSPVWCGVDPTTPVTTPINVNAALQANSTYYLLVGNTNNTVSSDFVLSIDLSYSGTVAGCPADYNGVNGVELLDIFAFLSDWFNGCTGPGTPVGSCTNNADFNHQNGVDLLDIFAFLNAWFAGPCS
jgi:hypothetical protein